MSVLQTILHAYYLSMHQLKFHLHLQYPCSPNGNSGNGNHDLTYRNRFDIVTVRNEVLLFKPSLPVQLGVLKLQLLSFHPCRIYLELHDYHKYTQSRPCLTCSTKKK
ncbi:hypothetical protein V6Z12_A07G135700 [Gossypium hirsutum]